MALFNPMTYFRRETRASKPEPVSTLKLSFFQEAGFQIDPISSSLSDVVLRSSVNTIATAAAAIFPLRPPPKLEHVSDLPGPTLARVRKDWAELCHLGQAILDTWCLLVNASLDQACKAREMYAWRCQAMDTFVGIPELAVLISALQSVTDVRIEKLVPLSSHYLPEQDEVHLACSRMNRIRYRQQVPILLECGSRNYDETLDLEIDFMLSCPPEEPANTSELLKQVWPPLQDEGLGGYECSEHNLAGWHQAIRQWVESHRLVYHKHRMSQPRFELVLSDCHVITRPAFRPSAGEQTAPERVIPLLKGIAGTKHVRLGNLDEPIPIHRPTAKRRKMTDKTYKPSDESPPDSPATVWSGRTRSSTTRPTATAIASSSKTSPGKVTSGKASSSKVSSGEAASSKASSSRAAPRKKPSDSADKHTAEKIESVPSKSSGKKTAAQPDKSAVEKSAGGQTIEHTVGGSSNKDSSDTMHPFLRPENPPDPETFKGQAKAKSESLKFLIGTQASPKPPKKRTKNKWARREGESRKAHMDRVMNEDSSEEENEDEAGV